MGKFLISIKIQSRPLTNEKNNIEIFFGNIYVSLLL